METRIGEVLAVFSGVSACVHTCTGVCAPWWGEEAADKLWTLRQPRRSHCQGWTASAGGAGRLGRLSSCSLGDACSLLPPLSQQPSGRAGTLVWLRATFLRCCSRVSGLACN